MISPSGPRIAQHPRSSAIPPLDLVWGQASTRPATDARLTFRTHPLRHPIPVLRSSLILNAGHWLATVWTIHDIRCPDPPSALGTTRLTGHPQDCGEFVPLENRVCVLGATMRPTARPDDQVRMLNSRKMNRWAVPTPPRLLQRSTDITQRKATVWWLHE